ncbi:MAG: hypothetical protein AB7O21_19760 [Gammaproteobacteria bacterium]
MTRGKPGGPLARAAFRCALAGLGVGLRLAYLASARFRAQVAHPRVVQVGSADGVFRHYRFTPRAVASFPGRVANPDVGVCFDSAGRGLVTLLSPRAVGGIVHALLDETAEYEGNAVLVLWFFGLTRFVLPIGRTAPLRDPPPAAYVAPDPHGRVAGRIVREPVTHALDPAWVGAHAQRAKMVMPRGSAGDAVRLW